MVFYVESDARAEQTRHQSCQNISFTTTTTVSLRVSGMKSAATTKGKRKRETHSGLIAAILWLMTAAVCRLLWRAGSFSWPDLLLLPHPVKDMGEPVSWCRIALVPFTKLWHCRSFLPLSFQKNKLPLIHKPYENSKKLNIQSLYIPWHRFGRQAFLCFPMQENSNQLSLRFGLDSWNGEETVQDCDQTQCSLSSSYVAYQSSVSQR